MGGYGGAGDSQLTTLGYTGCQQWYGTAAMWRKSWLVEQLRQATSDLGNRRGETMVAEVRYSAYTSQHDILFFYYRAAA